MKTFNFGEQTSKGELEPSVAGVLSLVPGLGQFYNGDRLKGWLFLEVGAINFMILMLIVCAESLSNGLAQFAVNHHFNANYALLKQLASFKLGHPGATLLFALCLAFIAFSVRDAYDRATNIKNREIYAGHFIELSEATSGSYLAHFALMGALLLLSVFLLIPAPPRTQVTEIEFVAQPETKRVKPPKTTTISTNNSTAQSTHRPDMPVRPRRGETAPTQASSSHSSAQSTPVSKPQPKPPAPVTTPLPAVRPPAPTPIAMKPTPATPMPARPMPVATANFVAPPTPMPSSVQPMPAKVMAGASFARPNAVPSTQGVGAFMPKPLLAMNTGSAASTLPAVATSPIGMAHSASNSQSWMTGRTPSGSRTGSGPAAPSVDTSSLSGPGDSHTKPTLADTSSGRTGPGKGTSQGEGPKPMPAKTGLGPGTMIALVPQTNSHTGDPNGGRFNSDPSTTGKGEQKIGTKEPKDADFREYLAALQRRIRRAWMPPRQPNSRSSIVIFTVGTNGELLGLHLQRSSGESAMDEAAIQSIRNSAPFPHLPPNSPDSVDVQFTFDYNVFGGGGGRQF